MKSNRTILVIPSILMLFSILLAACAPAATPVPTTVPPTTAPAASGSSLTIKGLVDKPLSLSESDLRAMKVAAITADQPKIGSKSFTGVRMSDLMTAASVQASAANLVMTGSDGYSATIDLPTVKACADCMVAFTETPGSFLSIMPSQAGKLWVKNLVSLEFK